MMTFRQKILRWAYPLFTSVKRWSGGGRHLHAPAGRVPVVPFHTLRVDLQDGRALSFESLKGKKVLLVNTASDCGFTAQYAELQKLHAHSRDELEIIAFPANDFQQQEKGSDEEVGQFCRVNFGIRFPLARKSSVVKGGEQHPVFRWLSSQAQNGWNDQAPEWNFSKYLVNEEGLLTDYFAPAISPLSRELMDAVNH